MAVYLVTWDLNREKANYANARTQFIAHIERYQHTKDPGLDSVHFVSTNWGAQQVSDDLQSKLDSNDRLIVTKIVSGDHQGWLSKSVWDWINTRL